MFTPISNSLISFRESALRFAFRIPKKDILNPIPASQHKPNHSSSSLELAASLKQALNQFKAEAMDELGQRVDYSHIRHSKSFQRFTTVLLPQLHSLKLDELQEPQNATAFWINLYNALAIHAVIEYDVQKSVGEGGFGSMVRFFRQAAYQIDGHRFSLEDIEHGILRQNKGNPIQFSAQFAPNDARQAYVISHLDPRIHFALNCASKSCPPVGVYTPENLDAQLDLATANYIQQETQLKAGELHISKLFSWYKKDFGTNAEIAAFLLKTFPDGEIKSWLAANHNNPTFKFLPYHWDLNI